jgi:hypothetical protein
MLRLLGASWKSTLFPRKRVDYGSHPENQAYDLEGELTRQNNNPKVSFGFILKSVRHAVGREPLSK